MESHSVQNDMSGGELYYRRHMPHYQPRNATFHIVFRLTGSLPLFVIEELRVEREMFEKKLSHECSISKRAQNKLYYERQSFEKFDVLLNGSSTFPRWLGEAVPADIVREAIHYRDGKVYDLFAYCIMPNHVHMIVDVGRNGIPTYKDLPLFRILQSLKRHTARQANKILNRCGTFWQDESYDHIIRDGKELERTIWYILMNPVSAGLIEDWKDWRWSYCKTGIIEM